MLGPEWQWNLWAAGGVLLLLLWGWWAHRMVRRALGYRRFRGTWYTQEQWEVLIKMIDEDNASGHRVMQHDEIEILREWRTGSKAGVGFDRSSGYL